MCVKHIVSYIVICACEFNLHAYMHVYLHIASYACRSCTCIHVYLKIWINKQDLHILQWGKLQLFAYSESWMSEPEQHGNGEVEQNLSKESCIV